MTQDSRSYWENLETETRSAVAMGDRPVVRIPGLTILAHPDLERIGERCPLPALAPGRDVPLSRLEPLFSAPGDRRRRALADPHLSRSPIHLALMPEGAIRITAGGTRTSLEANGREVPEDTSFSAADLESGVVLLLARRIALLLHGMDPTAHVAQENPQQGHGLVGESHTIVALRRGIDRIAPLDTPVLIRGETGTGKELVAQAIHRASRRSSRPFVAVNMGSIPPSLAAAELFGAAKGAFTGADRQRSGYFLRAHGGTLFLDEIGETPAAVQALLLRALETQVIQAVGAETERRVDVRILAATDAHLEEEIEEGRFRAPLLHRLESYSLRLPPLRERREDLGRLLLYFLRQEREALGKAPTMATVTAGDTSPGPWLPADLVARLALYDWPGNVRQLRNVARQLVIGNQGEAQLRMTDSVEEVLRDLAPPPRISAPPSAPAEALLATQWSPPPSASDSPGREVRRRHDRGVQNLLEEYHGKAVEGSVGSDSPLLAFPHAVDALGYALEYHELLADLGTEFGLPLEGRAAVGLRAETREGAPGLREILGSAAGRQTLLLAGAFQAAREAAQGDHPLSGPEILWVAHADPLFEVGIKGSAPFTPPGAPSGPVNAAPQPEQKPQYRPPGEVREEEVIAALRAHQYRIQPTAAALGVSRTSLYALIDASPHIRKARDLSREEIEAGQRSTDDLDALAERLQVSRKALRRRMTQLGLP